MACFLRGKPQLWGFHLVINKKPLKKKLPKIQPLPQHKQSCADIVYIKKKNKPFDVQLLLFQWCRSCTKWVLVQTDDRRRCLGFFWVHERGREKLPPKQAELGRWGPGLCRTAVKRLLKNRKEHACPPPFPEVCVELPVSYLSGRDTGGCSWGWACRGTIHWSLAGSQGWLVERGSAGGTQNTTNIRLRKGFPIHCWIC